MFKIISYLKKDTLKTSVIAIVFAIFTSAVFILFVVGDTYAASNYKVTFNRAEGDEVLKICDTDVNGKVDKECIESIDGWCSLWSVDKLVGGQIQSNAISSSDIGNITFTKNENYYCYANSSKPGYNKGCYVCNTNDKIMHWAANGAANAACPAGYTKSPTITNIDDCKVDSCYICKTDSNIMKWSYSGISDNNCPAGYEPDPENRNENECKTIIPDSCYVCKTDDNIMKWDNNGKADNNCSAGYEPDPENRTKNECKTIIPDSCYVCKTDDNVMKWDNNGDADNNCSAGYTPDNRAKNECIPIENPITGNALIYIVWAIGLGSLCYSIYYFKNLKSKN